MNEMTEPASFKIQCENFNNFLQAVTNHFRNGEDTEGLENFLYAMDELNHVVETDRDSQHPQINPDRLLPAMRGLYFYMRNQDIAGIADLLEDTIVPMTEEWLKGSEAT